jgi:hypothetical protein
VFKRTTNLTSGEVKDPGYNATFAPALGAWIQAAGALLRSKLTSVMMDPAALLNTTGQIRFDIPDSGLVTPDNSLWCVFCENRACARAQAFAFASPFCRVCTLCYCAASASTLTTRTLSPPLPG